MNNKILTWLNMTLTVLILGTVLFTGCNLFYGKNITVDRGIAHFYFECPDEYKVKSIDVRDELELKFTYVVLAGPYRGTIYPYIYIDISRPFEGRHDAQTTWEYGIRFYEVYENFEIINSSSVIVDGIQANEYVVAFTSNPDPDRDPPDLKPVDIIVKEIYFDYNGLIWNLSLRSSAQYFASNEIRFEQLIDSFKLLE